MRICIPTDSDEGLAAQVAGHLGRAPFLTLIDTDSGHVTVLANPPHAHGKCQPARPLKDHGVDVVVCAGAGKGAVAALEAADIRVLLTDAQRVDQALEGVRRGVLRVLGAEAACAGHAGQGCRNGAGRHSEA